jgi:hypothetical protein
LAISGEAHRDGQGYHVGRTFAMCTGSQWAVAGFDRFIAGLNQAAGAAADLPVVGNDCAVIVCAAIVAW